MCKCPSCDSPSKKRINRSLLLKFILGSKAYKCYHCKARFLKIPILDKPLIIKQGVLKEFPITS
jgi:hypothetical protein